MVRFEIAQMLIDGGIQYNSKNARGKTAIDECVNDQLKEKVVKLIQEK